MRKRSIATLAGLFSAVAFGAIPLRASSMFIDGDVPLGTPTSFSVTDGGYTAVFSGSVFVTVDSFFTWQPEALVGTDSGLTLTIQFYSDPGLTTPAVLDSFQMDFGTFDNVALDLTAFLGGAGGTNVGSASQTGTLQSSSAYEGVLTFGGVAFDTIQVTSATQYGIGDISAENAPEPGYFWMFPVVGLGLTAWKRRGIRL
jgi:hypothetical protein